MTTDLGGAVAFDARSPGAGVMGMPARSRAALVRRLALLVETVTGRSDVELDDGIDIVDREIGRRADLLWLACAVLGGHLPTEDDLLHALMRARLHGTWAALSKTVEQVSADRRLVEVEVLRGRVTCDVHTTAQTNYLSGIQRVVRETATRWERSKDVTFVSWADGTALRPLLDDEHWRMFEKPRLGSSGPLPVVVPWEGTHLSVELIGPAAAERVRTMARYSANTLGVVGYDCIPVTCANTVAGGMMHTFAHWLEAARQADRVAMISPSAAQEFRGVLELTGDGTGHVPEVESVSLAVHARQVTKADLAEAAVGLVLPGAPMVLVVGSHEPRKNHLAVLHSAELLWREGLRFNLVLIGAGTWNAEDYARTLAGLARAGRPVQSIRALPDRLLWAAYNLAHCTLFPSLNEGFGLPVAESLAVGTPVVASNFGSMRDILSPRGEPLGGILVDPRDDESLTDALRTMLTDEAAYRSLRAGTTRHGARTWDEYADLLWDYLVSGDRHGVDVTTENQR